MQTDQIENQAPGAQISHSTWVTWLECWATAFDAFPLSRAANFSLYLCSGLFLQFTSPHTCYLAHTYMKAFNLPHTHTRLISFVILLMLLSLPDTPIVSRSTYIYLWCCSCGSFATSFLLVF